MAKASVKAKKRLEERQKAYDNAKLNRNQGYNRPGSLKK